MSLLLVIVLVDITDDGDISLVLDGEIEETTDKDSNTLFDTALINVVNINVGEVGLFLEMSLVDETTDGATVLFNATVVYESDDAEVCLVLATDAAKEGMVDRRGASLLLNAALIDVTDGAMIVVPDDERSMLDIMLGNVTEGTEICLLFNATLIELMDNKDINVLLVAIPANVIDGVNICSLLDIALVAITGLL